VVHYKNDTYTEVATDIAYANGINYDSGRKLLFVASPRQFLVKVYSRADDGSLSFIEDIDCGTGPDNLEFGADGTVWSGAHPNLLRFAAYAKGDKETAPSEVIQISYRGKGDYKVTSVYVENGERMSGSSVAVPWGNLIFVGNVMDSEFLVLRR
jgi:arylesterase/paraoxonase